MNPSVNAIARVPGVEQNKKPITSLAIGTEEDDAFAAYLNRTEL
jgi:hypothetical protein